MSGCITDYHHHYHHRLPSPLPLIQSRVDAADLQDLRNQLQALVLDKISQDQALHGATQVQQYRSIQISVNQYSTDQRCTVQYTLRPQPYPTLTYPAVYL